MVNDEPERNPMSSLVHEIGRAAQAGWAQTARMTVLLAVAAALITVLIMAISRY